MALATSRLTQNLTPPATSYGTDLPATRIKRAKLRSTETIAQRSGESFEHTDTMSAEELVAWAFEKFSSSLVLSSSFGADSAVMLHLVTTVVPGIRVVFVDTGYLFPETYRFVEALQERFDFELYVTSPVMTTARQEALYGKLWEQGEEGTKRYLEINKVEPMQRALKETGARAWLAGLRAQQTEHRSALSRVGLQDGRLKIHPILHFSRKDVDAYIERHDLPLHPLVAEGYRSIGDHHSTIPVLPGDDERSGRLLGAKKECGLHLTASQRQSWDASRL